MSSSFRILAIDPGERRVGLAVSDELGIVAQGLETFDRKTGDFFDFLSELIQYYEVRRIVVGNPLSMSGESGATAMKALQLAEKIRSRFGVDVVSWDERLTSVEAKKVLKGTRAGKKAVDRVAAVLILQSYLDSLPRGGDDAGDGADPDSE